jgi:hypothetical protein
VSDQPDILYRDQQLCIATWRDVFLDVWLETGRAAQVRKMRTEHVAFLKRSDRMVASCTVMHKMQGMTSVDEEVRKEAAIRLQEVRDRTSASLMVVLSTGFTATVIRSLIAGVTMLSRPKYPHKVASSVEEGFTWLSTTLAKGGASAPSRTELERAYQAVVAADRPVGAIP